MNNINDYKTYAKEIAKRWFYILDSPATSSIRQIDKADKDQAISSLVKEVADINFATEDLRQIYFYLSQALKNGRGVIKDTNGVIDHEEFTNEYLLSLIKNLIKTEDQDEDI